MFIFFLTEFQNKNRSLSYIYIFIHIHTHIEILQPGGMKDLVSLQCPLAWHGKARGTGFPWWHLGVWSAEPGLGGAWVSNSLSPRLRGTDRALTELGQPSPDPSTHLQVRDMPPGALKLKPKVQMRKEFPDRPVGRVPRASRSREDTTHQHPQDPGRDGCHVHRGLHNQGGARLRPFLGSLIIGPVWPQAGETKWLGRGLGHPREPEVKMGCGWCSGQS